MTQEAGGQKMVLPDGTSLRGGLVNAGVDKSGFYLLFLTSRVLISFLFRAHIKYCLHQRVF